MITIVQGDSGYLLSISLKDKDNTLIPIADIGEVLFTFGGINKKYATTPTETDTVVWDSENSKFKIPFTQVETFSLTGRQYMQVRVKFTDQSIVEIRGNERTEINFAIAENVTL